MIDNIDLILPLLEFESEDDFYFLQILQRRKDNPELTSNSRVIKNYYVRSPEYLKERYHEIRKLCDAFNARAGIRLNRRSLKQTAHRAIVKMANLLEAEDFEHAYNAYDKAAGSGSSRYPKRWVLDVDDVEPGAFRVRETLAELIAGLAPEGKKDLAVIPSKTGFHLITTPFDPRKLNGALYPFPITIHKDNPTNLYIS